MSTGGTPRVGIFIQQMFPFGAFGCAQWSIAEHRRLLRWLKGLGYTAVVYQPFPALHRGEGAHNLLEHGALFSAGIEPEPRMDPGTAYRPDDPVLGTPEGLARAARMKEAMAYAREIGLEVWLMLIATVGTPGFCAEHPELMSPSSEGGVFVEGLTLCPSRPEALAWLLEHNRRQLEYFSACDGVALMPRDAGGCQCAACTPQAAMLTRLSRAYFDLIAASRPDVERAFLSWHVDAEEAAALATELPADVLVMEAPRIHAMDVPWEQYERRLDAWRTGEREVEAWLEIQENPTALLPSIYPGRIGRIVDVTRARGVRSVWATSAQNPYLFPLHLWMLPRLWAGQGTADELATRYLELTYGAGAAGPGMEYLRETERGWDLMQAESQREAGFLKILVVSFPARMLPERCMRDGVPEAVRSDLARAEEAAASALAAAECFADLIRDRHPLEANAVAASSEVFLRVVQMRRAKLPVLDAIHAGDAAAAVCAWRSVEAAAARMVQACRDAPNTDVLADRWRRLALLPERLRSLAVLLPALAENRRFPPVFRPLEMREVYRPATGGAP